ncbi:MAG: hypothetical protein ACRDG3_01680 [Tepidiformaceae bacterium]
MGLLGSAVDATQAGWFYVSAAILLVIAIGALAWVVTNSDDH